MPHTRPTCHIRTQHRSRIKIRSESLSRSRPLLYRTKGYGIEVQCSTYVEYIFTESMHSCRSNSKYCIYCILSFCIVALLCCYWSQQIPPHWKAYSYDTLFIISLNENSMQSAMRRQCDQARLSTQRSLKKMVFSIILLIADNQPPAQNVVTISFSLMSRTMKLLPMKVFATLPRVYHLPHVFTATYKFSTLRYFS